MTSSGSAQRASAINDTLAHPAREMVRVVVDPPCRSRNADPVEKRDRALPGLGLGEVEKWVRIVSMSCCATVKSGIEARQRVLEDHADPLAADPAQPPLPRGGGGGTGCLSVRP